MEQEIHISLRFNLAIGKVNLSEIVYELKKLRDPLMLKILEQILAGYDDLISERLSRTDLYPSSTRKGLGQHIRKNSPERFCRGRKVIKRGYRNNSRRISTVFGKLEFPWFRRGVIDCGDEAEEMGEDIGFCLQCAKADIPIYVDCDNVVGHYK